MEKKPSSLTIPRWAPFGILFLGAWLIVSPGTFGYIDTMLGMSDFLSGLAILILGWQIRCHPKGWGLGLIGLVGVWLQFAPIALRIPQAVGYLNDTLIGVLAIFFSLILSSHRETKGNPIPKGWTYNPSAYAQRLPVILLTCICWFLARYLAAYQLGFIDTMWDPFFGQGTIQVITSTISRSLPIPDAGLGAFAYTLEFLLGCHGCCKRWRTAPWLVLSFGLLVVPVGLVSILLITLQPLMVHAWCTVCLLTAVGMLIMIMLTLDEVAASLQLLQRGRKAGFRLWDLLWHGLAEGHEITDPRAFPLSAPSCKLFKVLFLGCSFPWNLSLATFAGVILMTIPSFLDFSGALADIDHVVGALIIVVSVVSMAEVVRSARYALWIFAVILGAGAIFYGSGITLFLHLAIGLLVALFAFRHGPLKETYGRN